MVFAAYQITNFFKEGKFTQRIEGTLREFNGELAPLLKGVGVPTTNNNNGLTTYTDQALVDTGSTGVAIGYDTEPDMSGRGGVAVDDDAAGSF